MLCVSTDENIREEARFGFPAGVSVTCAGDSREAWTMLQRFTPHAVIVDIQTGNAGGIDLAREMSRDPRLEAIPLLLLLQRAEDRWLADQGGADGILVKPVVADELVRATLSLIP